MTFNYVGLLFEFFMIHLWGGTLGIHPENCSKGRGSSLFSNAIIQQSSWMFSYYTSISGYKIVLNLRFQVVTMPDKLMTHYVINGNENFALETRRFSIDA